MKQQNSNGLLDDASGDFGGPGSPQGPGFSDQNAILNKFNNTVVLKKGQMTQVLKNSLVLPPGAITNGGGGHPSSGGNGGSPNPGQLMMGTTVSNGMLVRLRTFIILLQDVSPQRGIAGAGGSVPRRNSRNVNKPVITASNGLVGKYSK